MFEAVGTQAADRFDRQTRALDYRIELPIATLVPDRYLLTLDITAAGLAVSRTVTFLRR